MLAAAAAFDFIRYACRRLSIIIRHFTPPSSDAMLLFFSADMLLRFSLLCFSIFSRLIYFAIIFFAVIFHAAICYYFLLFFIIFSYY